MNKIQRCILLVICLLLSIIPIATIRQVWAIVPKQSTNVVNRLQQDQEELQALQSIQIQSIIDLVLQDDEEEKGYQVFLPIVRW